MHSAEEINLLSLDGTTTTKHPARPLSATLICFYEAAVVLIVMVGLSVDRWYRASHPLGYPPVPPAQVVAAYISYVLAICAAILLWRMRRTSSYLLSVRALISLIMYIFILFRVPSAPLTHHATIIRELTHVVGLVIVLLNAYIAWHVYGLLNHRAA